MCCKNGYEAKYKRFSTSFVCLRRNSEVFWGVWKPFGNGNEISSLMVNGENEIKEWYKETLTLLNLNRSNKRYFNRRTKQQQVEKKPFNIIKIMWQKKIFGLWDKWMKCVVGVRRRLVVVVKGNNIRNSGCEKWNYFWSKDESNFP